MNEWMKFKLKLNSEDIKWFWLNCFSFLCTVDGNASWISDFKHKMTMEGQSKSILYESHSAYTRCTSYSSLVPILTQTAHILCEWSAVCMKRNENGALSMTHTHTGRKQEDNLRCDFAQ
jgi:hypothetical protein